MFTDTDRIRMFNDELRQNLLVSGAVITPGIAGLGDAAVKRLIHAVSVFDGFCEDNDPYQEHDFGAFDFDGQRMMFKIDYYAKGMQAASPDPSDPSVTERVITLMLAEEY